MLVDNTPYYKTSGYYDNFRLTPSLETQNNVAQGLGFNSMKDLLSQKILDSQAPTMQNMSVNLSPEMSALSWAKGLTDIGSSIGNFIFGWYDRAKNEEYIKKTWEREDSAVQRRVADLRKAGLSPLLSVGSPGATSSPVGSLAPPGNPFSSQVNLLDGFIASQEMAQNELQLRSTMISNLLQLAKIEQIEKLLPYNLKRINTQINNTVSNTRYKNIQSDRYSLDRTSKFARDIDYLLRSVDKLGRRLYSK